MKIENYSNFIIIQNENSWNIDVCQFFRTFDVNISIFEYKIVLWSSLAVIV